MRLIRIQYSIFFTLFFSCSLKALYFSSLVNVLIYESVGFNFFINSFSCIKHFLELSTVWIWGNVVWRHTILNLGCLKEFLPKLVKVTCKFFIAYFNKHLVEIYQYKLFLVYFNRFNNQICDENLIKLLIELFG